MKMLDHPNIVKLYEVIDTPTTLYLVMEHASGGALSLYVFFWPLTLSYWRIAPPTGEVFDYLVSHGRMKEKDARARFREVLLSLIFFSISCVITHDPTRRLYRLCSTAII